MPIINVVNIYLGNANAVVPEIVTPVTLEVKDKTILVVDDSDIIRNFVNKIFSSAYEVIHAKDGGEAIEIFSGAIHYFRSLPDQWYDLLLKLKNCGLNTVETYCAWNLHEESPGKFDFTG